LGAVLGQLYDFADENLGKAGWNYWLIETDKSLGVHNYNFVIAVLDASIAALQPPTPQAQTIWNGSLFNINKREVNRDKKSSREVPTVAVTPLAGP